MSAFTVQVQGKLEPTYHVTFGEWGLTLYLHVQTMGVEVELVCSRCAGFVGARGTAQTDGACERCGLVCDRGGPYVWYEGTMVKSGVFPRLPFTEWLEDLLTRGPDAVDVLTGVLAARDIDEVMTSLAGVPDWVNADWDEASSRVSLETCTKRAREVERRFNGD